MSLATSGVPGTPSESANSGCATAFPPYLYLIQLYPGSKSGDYEEVRDQMQTKLLGNGTLLLQHVKEDREGFYLCQADNGIGTGIGKVIQLRVNCTSSESLPSVF